MDNEKLYSQGIYPDIPNNEYHASYGISKSGLDNIDRSPKHYQWRKNNPQEQTDAMLIGSALHTLVLEPEKFNVEYAIALNVDRRTKEGKAEYATFIADNAGKEFISQKDYDNCAKMKEAVYSHPAAQKLLTGGKAEQSFFWIDQNFRVLCKCRPDYLKDMGDYYIAVDIKTTDNASPKEWFKSAYKYRYHVQSAFYIDGIESVTNKPVKSFAFIVVEKTAPYGVAVYNSSVSFINEGRMDYLHNLKTYYFCKENEKEKAKNGEVYEWPCYADHLLVLDLPGYVTNKRR